MTLLFWRTQILSCFFLTGLIWVIQWIHYPSFQFISHDRFEEFHHFHTARITWIVAPMMSIELLSAIGLFWEGAALSGANLVSVILLWLITATISVPCHNRLEKGFDERWWKLLVWTNWSRTLLWSLRLAFLFSGRFVVNLTTT